MSFVGRSPRHRRKWIGCILRELSFMKSPDGKYEVLLGEYSEIRMGSPEFGEIIIQGASFKLAGRQFGRAMVFSHDSRFLAVEELVDGTDDLHTRALVFDLEQNRQIIVPSPSSGFVKKFAWSEEGWLNITAWSRQTGERQYTWLAPVKGHCL